MGTTLRNGIERADLLDDERCADNQTRVANRDFMDDAVRDAVARLAYTELRSALNRRISPAPVNNISKLKSHSDLHSTGDRGRSTVELPRVPGAMCRSLNLANSAGIPRNLRCPNPDLMERRLMPQTQGRDIKGDNSEGSELWLTITTIFLRRSFAVRPEL